MENNKEKNRGKVVLITGASKGIGRELAEIFAKNGYALILIARNAAELGIVQQALKNKYDCDAKILAVDLSKQDSIDLIMQTFKDQLSCIEVLINNAGLGLAKKFDEMSDEIINDMLAVNIRALTLLTHKILPLMLAKKSGKILNVASTAAFAPGPFMAVYYASKAYVLSFSQALYEEYQRDGILVSALCPGVTKTAFQARAQMEDTLIVSGFLPIMSAHSVAELAYHGLKRNKRVIITGIMNKITVFFMWLTPNFINAKVTAIFDRPKKQNKVI